MNTDTTTYRGRIKYNPETAARYQQREPKTHRAEMKLVDRAFALIPKHHRVLDLPCGGGRVTVHLGLQGYKMSSADLSDSMLAITRENVDMHELNCSVEKQDIENLTYPDQHFDSLISFRLFHHFPNPEIRQRAVSEPCRVTREFVVISYFSPLSVTSIKRSLRRARGGRASEKHSTPLAEVKGYFANAGFRFVKDFARTPLIHTLHVAVFEREGSVKRNLRP
jgi:ubiquinone/menaquinone biosynthesis C-methylase UbiE